MESGFDFFKGCLIFLLFILVGALIGGLVATLLTHMYIQGSDLKDDPGVIYVYLSYSFISSIVFIEYSLFASSFLSVLWSNPIILL